MGMDWHYKDGTPIPGDDIERAREWSRLKEDQSYSRIGSTRVGQWWVSTVWLGLDHSFGDNDNPVIFETMIFNQSEEKVEEDLAYLEEYCERYCTEEEAIEGHQRAVDSVQYVIHEVPTLDL